MKHLLVLILLSLSFPAFAQTNIIVAQQRAPLQLRNLVSATNSAPNPNARAGSGTHDRVVFLVRGNNAARQVIQAADVTFVAFNAFGELLGVVTSETVAALPARQLGQFTAETLTPNATTFHTAVAFVRRVRLADGSVWQADMAPVLAALRGVDPDFALSDLEP